MSEGKTGGYIARETEENRNSLRLLYELGVLLGFPENQVETLSRSNEILAAAIKVIRQGKETGHVTVNHRPPFPQMGESTPGSAAALGIVAAEYFLQLFRFVQEFNIPRDLPSRVRKAGEELGELAEAVALSWYIPPEKITEEAADLVTVGLDALILSSPGATSAEGVFRVLIDNLDRKAEKYRQGRNRTEERR